MRDGFIKTVAVSPRLKPADCEFNAKVLHETIKAAAEVGVSLIVLPELAITGCSCKDLFFQKKLQQEAKKALVGLAQSCPWQTAAIVGIPFENGGQLYDCAAVLFNGKILGIVPKTKKSADYGRWFAPAPAGNGKAVLGAEEIPFGANLLFKCSSVPEFCFGCEIGDDLFLPFSRSEKLAAAGVNLIVNCLADPELAGRSEYRKTAVCAQSAKLVCGLVAANAGEGESTSECVYGGENFIVENGQLLASAKPFGNGYCSAVIDLQRLAAERQKQPNYPELNTEGTETIPFDLLLRETRLERPVLQQPFVPEKRADRRLRAEEILQIQAHALKKRIEHTKAQRLVLGISGGLDSTLALLACVRALDLADKPRSSLLAYTMPCFGTSDKTKNNAQKLCALLGAELREIDIKPAVRKHFRDLGHDGKTRDAAYENAQARERTQLLMDAANMENGLVIGTGDLSELALGWTTYNGDHMSMYSLNAAIPKTLVRALVEYEAEQTDSEELKAVLKDILRTPVSPELLPAKKGGETQKTEEIIGAYELHDFFLYWFLRFGFSPAKICRLAKYAFENDYPEAEILKTLRTFLSRFFAQQYKRSCQPEGVRTGSASLSPQDWKMPGDAEAALWLVEMDKIDEEYAQRSSRKTTTYEQFKKNRIAKRMAADGKKGAPAAEKPRPSSMDMFLKQFGE